MACINGIGIIVTTYLAMVYVQVKVVGYVCRTTLALTADCTVMPQANTKKKEGGKLHGVNCSVKCFKRFAIFSPNSAIHYIDTFIQHKSALKSMCARGGGEAYYALPTFEGAWRAMAPWPPGPLAPCPTSLLHENKRPNRHWTRR